MKLIWTLLAASLLAPLAVAQQDEPVEVAYFYKVKWGYQQEYERLYMKNHYPIMNAEKERGRIKELKVYRPRFHGDGRNDWTFMVAITFASWAAMGEPSQEEQIARKLYPDYETFRKEEQRRFELLEAHWDVPLSPIKPPAK
jgi:hypothetical protein